MLAPNFFVLNHKKHKALSIQKKTIFTIIVAFSLFFNELKAQFPPSAGLEGSTAVAADSEEFVSWGTAVTVSRGFQNIADPALGYVDSGEDSLGIGQADNMTISLGDAGEAVVTFRHPIRNGEGWDFAVFENGFDDTFLELAFVEVSSDGEHFFRFPATSLTDTINEIGTFGLLDATKLDNLAGKYRLLHGTPFDLAQLVDIPNLDIDAITHVKLIDVVGSMDEDYASRDAEGHKINDPFPTPFPQGGFDLDAIGVRYEKLTNATSNFQDLQELKIYPNPIQQGDVLRVEMTTIIEHKMELALYQANGFFIKKINTGTLDTSGLERGMYFLKVKRNEAFRFYKVLIH